MFFFKKTSLIFSCSLKFLVLILGLFAWNPLWSAEEEYQEYTNDLDDQSSNEDDDIGQTSGTNIFSNNEFLDENENNFEEDIQVETEIGTMKSYQEAVSRLNQEVILQKMKLENLQNVEEENKTLKEGINDLKITVSEAQFEITRLEAENNELKERTTLLNTNVGDLENQEDIFDLRTKLTKKELEYNQLVKLYDKEAKKVNELGNEIINLENSNITLKNQIDPVKNENIQLKNELFKVKSQSNQNVNEFNIKYDELFNEYEKLLKKHEGKSRNEESYEEFSTDNYEDEPRRVVTREPTIGPGGFGNQFLDDEIIETQSNFSTNGSPRKSWESQTIIYSDENEGNDENIPYYRKNIGSVTHESPEINYYKEQILEREFELDESKEKYKKLEDAFNLLQKKSKEVWFPLENKYNSLSETHQNTLQAHKKAQNKIKILQKRIHTFQKAKNEKDPLELAAISAAVTIVVLELAWTWVAYFKRVTGGQSKRFATKGNKSHTRKATAKASQ